MPLCLQPSAIIVHAKLPIDWLITIKARRLLQSPRFFRAAVHGFNNAAAEAFVLKDADGFNGRAGRRADQILEFTRMPAGVLDHVRGSDQRLSRKAIG